MVNRKKPLTTAERQAAFKARRAAQGLKEIRGLYAHPDDTKRIRTYAERLTAKRLN